MLFQWTCLKLQQSGENLPRKLPPNQPRPCILFYTLQIFHNSGSEWFFFSVRDFNETVLLHRELYTGFLQRINQFSGSVNFANGYYENQLTDSNRWWYFYICQKFTYDRWITYLWLFVDLRATITSNFTGYRNTQNRQIYRTM